MKRLIVVFFSLIGLYFLSLTAVYSLPDFNVKQNFNASQEVLNKEGDWPPVSQYYKLQTMLDNFTDLRVMMPRTVSGNSPLVSAMSMGDYPRYWHGYQVFLKPLASFFDYQQIRFFYSILVLITFCVSFYFVAIKISLPAAIAFAISMSFAHIDIFGKSMQFSNIFIMTFCYIAYFLSQKDINKYASEKALLHLFIFGSAVNFIDLLTVPIISLGLPLIILILAMDDKYGFKGNLLFVIKSSVYWSLGYALTWVSKWLIASLILNKNVVSDALTQMIFRTTGDGEQPLDRANMIYLNFINMFHHGYVALIIVAIFAIALFCKTRPYFYKVPAIALISLMPYVWYEALSNHSQVHFWFTYRAQTVTMFACLVILFSLINRKKTI